MIHKGWQVVKTQHYQSNQLIFKYGIHVYVNIFAEKM